MDKRLFCLFIGLFVIPLLVHSENVFNITTHVYGTGINVTQNINNVTLEINKTTGTYTGGVIDAGKKVNWQNVSWTYTNDTPQQNITLRVRTGDMQRPLNMSLDGMVAYWPLNETYGCNDYLGLNNGTAGGDVVCGDSYGYFQGENGTGFDGVNDYITASVYNIAVSTDSFSIYALINWDGTGDAVQFVVANSVDDNNKLGISIDTATGYVVAGVRVGSAQGKLRSNNPITAGVWTHILYTRAPGPVGKLYINGVLQTVGAGSTAFSPVATAGFTIGSRTDEGFADFNGSIQHVALWNRSLTPEEIGAWSAWTLSKVNQGISNLEEVDNGRFLQYEASFNTDNTTLTPVLSEIVPTGKNMSCSGYYVGSNRWFDSSDFCTITSDEDILGNEVHIYGNQYITNSLNIQANITNLTRLYIYGQNAKVTCSNKSCFKING